MKDIINMDDLNLDNTQTLKSSGFEKMSLGKLLKDNELEFKSKGLSSLLGESSIEKNETDHLMLNEILRTIRDNNESVIQKLTILEDQIFDVKTNTNLKTLKTNKKLILLSLLVLVIGVSLGRFIDFDKKEAVKEEKIIPVKKQTFMVTTKFMNLRSLNTPKSKILFTIPPSQLVTILETKGGWLRVKYHDLLSGVKYQGHLWSKYLKTPK